MKVEQANEIFMRSQVIVVANRKGVEECFWWDWKANESIADWLKRWKQAHPGWRSQEVLPIND